ncbi:Crp/Fnr family transcriptional regulator [Desulfocicer vacuolatum]|nr:Crp/Fnr family transcriptional regulator [Desulfocicer vacuolatum]
MDTTCQKIRTIPLFSGLNKEDFEGITAIAQRKKYKKGELIFNEGDEGNGFYIVETGKVKIFKLSFGGKEQILHIYGPGKPFGEVPVFTGKNFPATAQAVVGSTLIFFPRKDFIARITENPSLALNMLAVLSKRLREFTVMVENLALKEVPARLASYLGVLTKEQNNLSVVTLPVSKNQLAGLLGTTPETLSRIFSKMSGQGLIGVDRGIISILDAQGVADMAEGG